MPSFHLALTHQLQSIHLGQHRQNLITCYFVLQAFGILAMNFPIGHHVRTARTIFVRCTVIVIIRTNTLVAGTATATTTSSSTTPRIVALITQSTPTFHPTRGPPTPSSFYSWLGSSKEVAHGVLPLLLSPTSPASTCRSSHLLQHCNTHDDPQYQQLMHPSRYSS